MKSDNDDRDEEHQMELGNNTMSSNNNKYSDDDWDHKRKYEKTYISTVEYLIAIQIYIFFLPSSSSPSQYSPIDWVFEYKYTNFETRNMIKQMQVHIERCKYK